MTMNDLVSKMKMKVCMTMQFLHLSITKKESMKVGQCLLRERRRFFQELMRKLELGLWQLRELVHRLMVSRLSLRQ